MLLLLPACKNKTDYKKLKECQDYQVALWKDDMKNKSALFIFPHPDDEITCGGTIDQLRKSGWKINLVTLTTGQPEEKVTRLKEWNQSCAVLGFNNFEIYDLINNTWDNVLLNRIDFWYDHLDSIENITYRSIMKYQPSVVFTYDTALGGYGHPEHRISALAACHVFNKYKSDSLFPVKKILQRTLPEKLENLIFVNSEAYAKAKEYTGNTTLPDPTVSFDILKNWTVKRNAAAAYASQSSILKKFYLFPDIKDTAEHFATFDREYFFTIDK